MPCMAGAFERMRDERRGGLVTYVTAGDPSLARTADILRALDRAGADVLEVGVPFSDPLADGPIIQRACERALAAGATLGRVLDVIGEVRPSVRAPIVLFSYANPVYRMGFDAFAARAAAAGVDGVLALDLPVEEAGPFRDALLGHDLDPIYLLSPTTAPERARRAGELGRGFLYLISRAGVTGARDSLAAGLPALASRVFLGHTHSWSEANWDEKAFTVLPESGLIILPFNADFAHWFIAETSPILLPGHPGLPPI